MRCESQSKRGRLLAGCVGIAAYLGARPAGAKPKRGPGTAGAPIRPALWTAVGYVICSPCNSPGPVGSRGRFSPRTAHNNNSTMKALRLFSAALGLLAAGSLRASDQPSAPRRTEVVFDHPEKFTDVRDSSMPSDRGRDSILSELRDDLVARASPMVPDGYKLTVTFTDIKLAGDFEPWRGPQWDDIRIVKAIYPPSSSSRIRSRIPRAGSSSRARRTSATSISR